MKKTLVTLALVAVGIAAFAVEFDWKTNIALNRALNDNRAKQDPAVVVQAMEYADGVTARTDQEKISLIAIRRTARTQTAGTDRSWKANKEFVDAQLAAAQLTKPADRAAISGVALPLAHGGVVQGYVCVYENANRL